MSEYEQELDSHDARADFENVLQGMLAKANAGESLTPTAATPSATEDEHDVHSEEVQKLPSTPTKSSRKRRRKDDSKDDKQKSNSFIMKLFDRSIDLALFNEETPLYPICRAWMHNDPSGKLQQKYALKNKRSEEEATSASDDEDGSGNVHAIPPPSNPWNNIGPDGKYSSPRIPDPIPQPSMKLEEFLLSPISPPDPETLLVDHIHRWRAVRTSWIEKSIENDARYEDGMTLLKDVFNRHLYNSQ